MEGGRRGRITVYQAYIQDRKQLSHLSRRLAVKQVTVTNTLYPNTIILNSNSLYSSIPTFFPPKPTSPLNPSPPPFLYPLLSLLPLPTPSFLLPSPPIIPSPTIPLPTSALFQPHKIYHSAPLHPTLPPYIPPNTINHPSSPPPYSMNRCASCCERIAWRR